MDYVKFILSKDDYRRRPPMRRMSGFDAQFVFDERPGEPQHTLKLAFLDADASRGFDLAAARRLVSERLARLDPLRWRVARVPLDLHQPVWLESGAPDLGWHVRRAAIPAPGGRPELCEVVSQIASVPLDPRRPLWELWLLEGFEGQKVVLALKLSHALADGGESHLLLERLFGPVPETSALPAAESPSRLALLRSALRDAIRDLARLAAVARTTLANAWRGHAQRLPGPSERLAPTPLRHPRTGFGGPLGPRRAFHYQTVSLAHARAVGKAFGCTLNEVLIAIVAGGVRRWLWEQRHLPGLATIGYLPISTRTESERGAWGNRVVSLPLALPTHLADPVARLRAAARENARLKAAFAAQRGGMIEDWQNVLSPLFTKSYAAFARAAARLRPRLSGGVVVSNVRGPVQPFTVAGGSVENLVSVGHVKWVSGLNVTAWSYAGQLNLALYAAEDAFPDLGRVASHLGDAFEELAKAAAQESARVGAEGGGHA
jgi:diacylglycerol O-acyltransferase